MGDRRAGRVRTRLSVPEDDWTTVAWMEKQQNVSASVRRLVHAFVYEYGLVDTLSVDDGMLGRAAESGASRLRAMNAGQLVGDDGKGKSDGE